MLSKWATIWLESGDQRRLAFLKSARALFSATRRALRLKISGRSLNSMT